MSRHAQAGAQSPAKSRGRSSAKPAERATRPVQQVGELALLAGLSVLALLVLRTTYGGTGYLISGGAGIAAGLALSYAGAAFDVPVLGVAVATVAAYFLVGLAVPGPRSLDGMLSLAGNGWKQLLTTLPPIGNAGPLLGIPFLLTLVATALGGSLALRCRPTFAPLGAPTALFAAAILLGMPSASTLWLGAAFVALALGWSSLRYHRTRPTVAHGARQTTRIATGLVMLVLAGFGAAAIGPGLPLAGANSRLVLRDYVHPPFDVQQYPSPLAGFRKYAQGGALYNTTLFTETGLPAGAPLRIATMTTYDGTVWGTGDPTLTTASTDTFQRVGTTIATTDSGPRTAVTVHVAAGYHDVWVPTAGQLSAVSFNAAGYATAFRYNLDTDTGVIPQGLSKGNTVTMNAQVPPPAPGLSNPTPFGAPDLSPDVTTFVVDAVGKWTNGVTGMWPQIMAVAAHLREDGKYSDGVGDEAQYLPGHSIGRLTTFLSGPQLVGDDEQYAAIFALMANYLGMPTRVVLGALPEPGGVIKGKDVHAWVEVHVADGSWREIPTSQFMPDSSKKPDKIPPQNQQNTSAAVVPPPNSTHPPSSQDGPDQQQTHVDQRHATPPPAKHAGFRIPHAVILAATYGGPPILAILLACLAVVAVKGMRRRRRRRRGPPATQVAAGWRELVDYARDTGRAVPAGQTRAEDARTLAGFGLSPLAASADSVVFGPGQPGADAADWYWSQITHTRRQIRGELSRWRRLRAALSLRSLRAPTPPIRVNS